MYPNPIFAREKTSVINDGWQFSFDNRSWREIKVPFCPQSKLSGIGYTDFIPVCYYKKSFTVPKTDKRVILHFGAVEWAKENGYALRGDVRERYVHGAWDRGKESEWETEVQLPIVKE